MTQPTPNPQNQKWSLPNLRKNLLLDLSSTPQLPYDVKFYPFGTDDSDPIFAVASARNVFVYRISIGRESLVRLVYTIRDVQDDGVFHSLVWTKDVETGDPLICVAGSGARIQVFNLRKRESCRTLIGHGGDVNDLAILPTDLRILASASADNTIRLWNLDLAHQKAPCVVVYAGEGHRDTVLSISFHASGRYLLSGGLDHVVNLWKIPEMVADAVEGTVIHCPLFSTSEVHSDIVDCVAFHGDLILSKAYQERCIVLWRITGFDSSLPTPALSSAPTNPINKRGTRSAFSSGSQPHGSQQYVRLLQFSTPKCEQFYMRFSLSSGAHPTLAICNSVSQVFFWDFARFEEYHRLVGCARNLGHEGDEHKGQPSLPPWLITTASTEKKRGGLDWRRTIEPSNTDSVDTGTSQHTTSTDATLGNINEISEGLKRRYETGNPWGMVEAHGKETLSKTKRVGRQVAWSTCGRWCVAVSEPNAISILQRGDENTGHPDPEPGDRHPMTYPQ